MKLPLTDGAYTAKSIIASAQRCVNLYTEVNPQDSVFPTTHYLTPGLIIKTPGPSANPVRQTFRASNGELFSVVGDTVYFVQRDFSLVTLGTINAGSTTVYLQDNGLVILICDDSEDLWAIDLATHAFAAVMGANFYGATRIDYIDTYFILNRPGTNQWYISLSEVTFQMLTGTVGSIISGSIDDAGNTGAIATAVITSGGSSYTNGTYAGVFLSGGSGTGAVATITVSGNAVTSVTFPGNTNGINYVTGDILTASATSIGGTGSGFLYTVSSIQGTYVDGTYTGVYLLGGTGTGAIATITVDNHFVTDVTITSPGQDYVIGDTLIFDGKARGTYTFTTNPTNSQTIILNGVTWTFVTAGAGVAQTNIGVDLATTLTQLATDLNASVNVNLTPATYFASATILQVAYDTATAGGNAYTLAAGTYGGTISGPTLTGGITNNGTGFLYVVATIGGGAFDALDIATKNGYPDPIETLIVMHREIWLVGALTTEVWYNSGAPDFTFQVLPGTFIEHGTIAPYSVAAQDLSIYWLSQDKQGQAIIMRGNDYTAKRISTFAIENELSKYPTLADAIGFTYQQEGHAFYILTFPTANKTWVYDQAAELWHERAWLDNQGQLNRHRANCCANAYNVNVVGDWENGNLYTLDLDTYVDNVDGDGNNPDGSYPISRIRSWPALVNEGKRVSYQSFTADVEVGNDLGIIDGTDYLIPPMMSLRWSDDRGKTYSNALQQSIGAVGQYLTQPEWDRLGLSRGRVWELSWSVPGSTALNGAWVNATPAGS